MFERHLYHCVFFQELSSYPVLNTLNHNWQAVYQEFL